MSEKAVGVSCPSCGTLTACSGNYDDELLTGRCALGHTVSAPNHRIERVAINGNPVAAPTYVQVKDPHAEPPIVIPAPSVAPAPTWGAPPPGEYINADPPTGGVVPNLDLTPPVA
jgi:hypothetical protein